MGQYTLQINSQVERLKALDLTKKAPTGTYITWKRNKRTTDQNSLMWALLTIISKQIRWNGNEWIISDIGGRYSPENWKQLFAASLYKTQFMPDLDGGMLPLNPSTSNMSKEQHSELCELIIAQASKWGINIKDIQPDA
jgi:hypothetical protein